MLVVPPLIPPAAADALPNLAVGGGLRMGFAGALRRAGLPFELLDDLDHCDVTALRRYDVVLVAGLAPWAERWTPDASRALDSYVRGGGALLCEMRVELPTAMDVAGDYSDHPWPPENNTRPFRLLGTQHPLARRLPADRAWEYGGPVRILPPQVGGWEVLARFTAGPAKDRPAVLARSYGRGKVVYFAADVSYMQGNWTPAYEDLILAAVAWLSDGQAVRQWASEPLGEAPHQPLPPAPTPLPAPALDVYEELAATPPDGYAVRLAPGAEVELRLERTGAREWIARLGPGRATLTKSVDGAATTLLDTPVPADAASLVLHRDRERFAIAADGAVLAAARVPLAEGTGNVARADGAWWFQPLESIYFADDFTRVGGLTEPWSVDRGRWLATGPVQPYSAVAGFALRGWGGEARAGHWFWANYRASVSVRPRHAKQVRLAVARWDDGRRWELYWPVDRGEGQLVRIDGDHAEPLAGGLPPLMSFQWTRVAIAVRDGRLAVEMDGRRVLDMHADGLGLGDLSLGGHGGDVLFDDLVVQSLDSLRSQGLAEVHPADFDKGPDGLLDRDTWSHAAAAWQPEREPRRFRHEGLFTGELRLALPLRIDDPERARVRVELAPPASEGVALELAGGELTGDAPRLVFARRDGRLTASIDGEPAGDVPAPDGPVELVLSWDGGRVAAEDVSLRAEHVHEYVFDGALDDGWEAEGDWQVGSRWPCQPQWAWLTGRGTPRAVWWHKRRVAGDARAEAWLGVRMLGRYGSRKAEPFERLRLTLCGDGSDPWSGYTLEIGSGVEGLSRLYRKGEVIASARLRPPHWREVHNFWAHVRFERVGPLLRASFQGRPLFEFDDPDPLADGQVAIWTEDNTLVTPYLCVYGEMERDPQPLPSWLARQERERRERAYGRPGFRPLPAMLALARLLGWEEQPAEERP